jgi:hypothetical protein
MKLSSDGKTLLRVSNDDITKEGSFDFPQGVTFIGTGAFIGCSSLKKIIIPQRITSIDALTFNGCVGLNTVSIPRGVTAIHEFTFYYCNTLRTIIIPDGVTVINQSAFYDCPNLKNIVIASKDEATLKRITGLLPNFLRSKVVPMEQAEIAYQICKEQLARLSKIPEANPLYRFFNQNAAHDLNARAPSRAADQSRRTLPNDIFELINLFVINESPYYQKAQTRILGLPLPRNKEAVPVYMRQVEVIVSDCILKVREFIPKKTSEKTDKYWVPKTISCQLM